jgi:CheY-like chemotaxis protein
MRRPVLVVEDDAAIREAIAEVLQDEGHVVHVAANGREALAHLHAGHDPCLVLLDLMMPVMNGWELIEAMREHDCFAQIPVVVISASEHSPPEGGQVRKFVKKPVDLDMLLALVGKNCAEP